MVGQAVRKGKPCGEGHIAADKECTVGQGRSSKQSSPNIFSRYTVKASDPPSEKRRKVQISKGMIGLAATIGGLAAVNVGVAVAFSVAKQSAAENASKKADRVIEDFARKIWERENSPAGKSKKQAEEDWQKVWGDPKNREEFRERVKQAYWSQAKSQYNQWSDNARSAGVNTPKVTDWYKTLGVGENASRDEIKTAYRKLAKQFHPDINKDPSAVEMMQKINEAFGEAKKQGRADTVTTSPIAVIKRVIETVYLDGVDAILKADVLDDGTIDGIFKDEDRLFEFKITPANVISYVSIDRTDSYLDAVSSVFEIKTDARKKRQCSTGISCGATCIAKGLRCHVTLSRDVVGALESARSALQNTQRAKDKAVSGLPAGVIAGIVAGAAIAGVPVAGYMAFRQKYRNDFKNSAAKAEQESRNVETQLREQAAQRTGKPPEELTREDIYAVERYPSGSDKKRIFKVDPEKPGITFTIGGFNDYGEDGTGMAVTLKRTLDQDSIIPLTNKKLQITPEDTFLPMNDILDDTEDPDGQGGTVKRGYFARRGATEAMRKVLGDKYPEFIAKLRDQRTYKQVEPVSRVVIRNSRDLSMLVKNATTNGYHPDSIDAAANILAFSRAYPEKDIKIVAHSGGGYVASEATEILNQLGVKVRTANIATPYWGLTNIPKEQLITIGSPGDYMTKAPLQNRVTINDVTSHNWVGHGGTQGYGSSKQVASELRKFFYGEAKKDSIRLDKGKGKKCGRGYIPEDKECTIGKGEPTSTRSRKSNKAGELKSPVGAVARRAASGARAIAPTVVGLAATGAFLGLSAPQVKNIQSRYRDGYKKSVEMAKKMADDFQPDELNESTHGVTFTTGGFSGDGIGGTRLKEKMEDLGVKGQHYVPVTNEEFDIRTEEERAKGVKVGGDTGKINLPDFVLRASRASLTNMLRKGRNETAVKLAAQAYAYHKKYPDKQITLVGHSAGGITSREAAELLEMMGVKSKVIAIGSPYVGVSQPTDDTMTIASKKDLVLKGTGNSVMRGAWFDEVKGHSMEEYFESDRVKELLRLSLEKKQRKDSKQCEKGKPCGNTCIARGNECSVKLSLRAIGSLPDIQAALKTTGGSLKMPAAVVAAAGTPGAIPAALAAAALGIPLAAYTAKRDAYRAGFENSAELARVESRSYEVPKDLKAGFRSVGDQDPDSASFVKNRYSSKKPEQITFFVGGLAPQESDWMGEEVANMFPSHHVVAIDQKESLPERKEGDRVANPDFLYRAVKAVAGQSLEQGYNTISVRTAARMYAYHKQYPDMPLNLIGQSGGAMVARETAEILKRMGVRDVKIVSSGGPNFGLTDPSGITLTAKDDPLVKIAGSFMVNKVPVSSPAGHSSYFVEVDKENNAADRRAKLRREGQTFPPNKEVQKILTDYFDRSKKDAADAPGIQQQIAKAVVAMINEGYRGGINRLVEVSSSGNTIIGTFMADGEMFDFRISGSGTLSYNEQDPREKRDSVYVDINRVGMEFLRQLRSILSRSYKDGIDRFTRIDIKPDLSISGTFVDDGKSVDFNLTDREVVTKLASLRRDSADPSAFSLDVDRLQLEETYRLDAPRRSRKKQCEIGISCGNTCISQGKTCRINTEEVASPSEMQRLRVSASRLRNPDGPEVEDKTPDGTGVSPLDQMTIRELKKEASTRGISRYNVMTKEELKSAIKIADDNPEQQARIKKTIERAEKEREMNPVSSWKRIIKSKKRWGRNDIEAAWAAGSVLLGASLAAYKWMKERYRGNFAQSANTAVNRARSLEVPNIGNKKYVTFTVDGFSVDDDPNKGRHVSTALYNADPERMKSHHIVPMDGAEFTDLARIPADTPDALRMPVLLTLSAARSLKTTLFNGSNPKSVDLASQILAYKTKYPGMKVNLVGHGAGGQVINEALEIVAMADPLLASDLRVTNIGTPNFGLTEQKAGMSVGKRGTRGRSITVTSANDPLSFLPKTNPITINTVKSHDINAYLGDERARQVIIESINDPPTSRPTKRHVAPTPKGRRRKDSEVYLEAFNLVLTNG